MAILTLPAAFKIRRATWGSRANSTTFVSPLNRGAQTQSLPGDQWTATIEAPPMPRADAAACFAWLVSLAGQAGRFYLSPPACEAPRGTAGGAPVISGAGQTGRALATIGWASGATLLAGDYLSFPSVAGGAELKVVTANATATGAGAMTVPIAPPIRSSPANGAAVATAPARGVFRLIDDEQAQWAIEEAVMFGLAFNAVESFFGV